MEKQKCPELRFKGFLKSWYEIRLSDVTNCYSGGTPSVGIKSFYGGVIPFIRSGEISDDKTELFLTEDGLNNSSAKLVNKGDILYALYGATSGEVSRSKIDGAINQAILAIIPTQVVHSDFLTYWLRKSKLVILNTYLQGGQGNLSAEIIKNLIVRMPNFKKEQTVIGNFFQNLDQSIALHEKKLTQTQNLKKAMLEKMFPKAGNTHPEIRLKGFSGDWESKSNGDILKIKSGMSQKKIEIEKGRYPILATGGEIGRTDTPLYTKESVLIGRKGTIDKPYYMNSPFWTVDTLFYSEISESNFAYFIYVLFQKINWRNYNTSTGVPSLTSSTIHDIEIQVPEYHEQKMIAHFFRQLDETLVLQKQQLQTLKNLKQAFLEKMFV